MDDDRKLAGYCNSCALETKASAEFEAPTPQTAFRDGTCENNGGGLIEYRSQMSVPTARYMAVIINLAGLVTL